MTVRPSSTPAHQFTIPGSAPAECGLRGEGRERDAMGTRWRHKRHSKKNRRGNEFVALCSANSGRRFRPRGRKQCKRTVSLHRAFPLQTKRRWLDVRYAYAKLTENARTCDINGGDRLSGNFQHALHCIRHILHARRLGRAVRRRQHHDAKNGDGEEDEP